MQEAELSPEVLKEIEAMKEIQSGVPFTVTRPLSGIAPYDFVHKDPFLHTIAPMPEGFGGTPISGIRPRSGTTAYFDLIEEEKKARELEAPISYHPKTIPTNCVMCGSGIIIFKTKNGRNIRSNRDNVTGSDARWDAKRHKIHVCNIPIHVPNMPFLGGKSVEEAAMELEDYIKRFQAMQDDVIQEPEVPTENSISESI